MQLLAKCFSILAFPLGVALLFSDWRIGIAVLYIAFIALAIGTGVRLQNRYSAVFAPFIVVYNWVNGNRHCICGSSKQLKKCGLLNTSEHQTNMAKGGAKHQ